MRASVGNKFSDYQSVFLKEFLLTYKLLTSLPRRYQAVGLKELELLSIRELNLIKFCRTITNTGTSTITASAAQDTGFIEVIC
jgi:hypothetical protein